MSKNKNTTNSKNARPAGRRDSQSRSSGRSRRGRDHHISVRGELRDKPDIRRIARTIIAMETARAEAEAAAQNADELGHEEEQGTAHD